MKKLLFLASIFFQTSVYSEVYSCLYQETKTSFQEQIVYKRDNDKFISTESGVNGIKGDTFYEVYNEDKEFLVITLDKEIYPSIIDIFYVVGFNKKDGTVKETKMGLNNSTHHNRIGKCIFIDT